MRILAFFLYIILLRWFLPPFFQTFPRPSRRHSAKTTLADRTRVLNFRPFEYAVETERVSAAVQHSLDGHHTVANAAVYGVMHESCGNHIFAGSL